MDKNKVLLLLICFLLFLTGIGFSQEEGIVNLTPSPQEIVFKESGNIGVDSDWTIIVNKSAGDELFVAQELQRAFTDNHEIVLTLKDFSAGVPSKKIIFYNYLTLTVSEEVLPNISLDNNFNKQGYVLEVFPDETIIICALNAQGLFYGTQTLKQLISKSSLALEIPIVKIRDWPNHKIRGVHFCAEEIDNIYKIVDKMVALKMNTAIIERDSWYDYGLKQISNLSEYKELFDYCRKRYIEPIPCVQNFGVSASVLSESPECAEGIWVEKEKFNFIGNIAKPIIPAEIDIKNQDFEIDDDVDGVPDGWDFYTDADIVENFWDVDKNEFYLGSRSVKVSIDKPGNSNPLVQSVNVTPNTAYSLEFYAKKAGARTAGYPISLRVAQWDKDGKFIIENYMPVKNSQWQRHVLNFVTQPECSLIHIVASINNSSGQFWLDSLRLKRMNGSLVNVIRTKTSDISITSLDGSKKYIEGLDYSIKDGDMFYLDYDKGDAYPYDIAKRKQSVISRVKGGNIKESETVSVSYDFILQCNPFPWKMPYCPQEPKTYEVLFESLDHLINSSLRIKSLLFGESEIFGMNRDSRCIKAGKSNADLLASDINKVYSYIKGLNPNITMIVMDDMLNPDHYGGRDNLQMVYSGRVRGSSAPAINHIPKDILIYSWWYDAKDTNNKIKNSSSYFKSKGFDYLAVTWYNKDNIDNWAEVLRQKDNSSFGMINTNWPDTPKPNQWQGLELTAGCAWNYNCKLEEKKK
ncbi:MAG: hypothetical protein GY853_05180 [PVC group bacterium]|nr:hypothetical protein [PVC group bacterium]